MIAKRVPWLAAVLVAAFALSGCLFGSTAVSVAEGAGSVTVPAGRDLHVTFGEVNASIGDAWYLTSGPDTAVLTDKGPTYKGDCAGTVAGCGAHLTWVFHAVHPGTTSVSFRYCFRSQPATCKPEPGRGPATPVTLAVTVS